MSIERPLPPVDWPRFGRRIPPELVEAMLRLNRAEQLRALPVAWEYVIGGCEINALTSALDASRTVP